MTMMRNIDNLTDSSVHACGGGGGGGWGGGAGDRYLCLGLQIIAIKWRWWEFTNHRQGYG